MNDELKDEKASLYDQTADMDPEIDAQGLSLGQLKFDFDTPQTKVKQRVSGFKMLVKRKNDMMEVSTLWKSPSLPFAIVSMLIDFFYLIYIIIFQFDKISPKIPLIYNAIENHWQQTDKSVLIVGGLLYLIVEGILVYLITKIFPRDKRLGLTMSYLLTFLNLMLLIYIIQIHYLIT